MTTSKIISHVTGFPRLGAKRKHKWTLERYWNGKISEAELHEEMFKLRQTHWRLQVDAGLSMLTAGDFAYYDHILELSEALGVVPDRHDIEKDRLSRCFAMARGGKVGHALEMKKWFNTNYHYMVPEFEPKQQFICSDPGAMPPDSATQSREAAKLGLPVKAALTGPLTYLFLAKLGSASEFDEKKLDFAEEIAEAYVAMAARIKKAGATWLQLDEPVLSLDVPNSWMKQMEFIYDEILGNERPKVMIANSYGQVGARLSEVANINIDGFHVDMRYGPNDLDVAKDAFKSRVLSVGAIDGRNVWRANLPALYDRLKDLADHEGGLWIGSSCSMMHTPMDARLETELLEQGLPIAFAIQKIDEIAALARTLEGVETKEDKELFDSSPKLPIADPGWYDTNLATPALQPSTRKGEKGQEGIDCPTTTIGSLPQTKQIREARASWRKGELSNDDYEEKMREEIKNCVEEQVKIGLDVIVHGECERNDMVEYFAHYLDGFAAPKEGWVQSYGSRATRPPIIHKDISRPEAMTVKWSRYAASLTSKPMKGMLTGPITMICWAFPRADVPRMTTADQIADALKAEVTDLYKEGISIIQIDEPALREGLPLEQKDHEAYLAQSVAAFNKIVVGSKAQIHTHMCYGEFNDVALAIAAMDADVISLETSRTDMSVLNALAKNGHTAGVGPGVYDVHSPRVPDVEEMAELLYKAFKWVPRERMWINPDCGLKTRGWKETREALVNMVAAAAKVRADGTN